jgi:nitrate reductase (NAD(P)H)
VRNHGAAPNIKWEEHRITVDVNGSVKKTFTMNNIVNMPSQRIPVTLVCAGVSLV